MTAASFIKVILIGKFIYITVWIFMWKQIYILQKHLLKIPTTISLCIYLFVLFWWSVSEALMFPGHNWSWHSNPSPDIASCFWFDIFISRGIVGQLRAGQLVSLASRITLSQTDAGYIRNEFMPFSEICQDHQILP